MYSDELLDSIAKSVSTVGNMNRNRLLRTPYDRIDYVETRLVHTLPTSLLDGEMKM